MMIDIIGLYTLQYLFVDTNCCITIIGYVSEYHHPHFLADNPLLLFIIVHCNILFYTNFELKLTFSSSCNFVKCKTDIRINLFEY